MIGQRINNYEITSLLGQGGMGSVYVAQHPVLGRRVAVKLLRPEYTVDENLVARFFNEARASSAIHHPGIIEVFDVGTLPDGQPYLMMELLEGVTLAGHLEREQRLHPSDAVDLTLQAAAALAAAHTHGIVHRDLKPDNMFLVADSTQRSGQRVKILDFGIAKLHRRWTGLAIRTHTGTVMGTPPYMSPEQCRGVSSEIDHRTDIYALGIILYQMLVGEPPFLSEGFGDVMMMHLTEPPRPPREIDATIPPAVEAAVLRALEKDPRRRFSDMDELARALAGSAARPTVDDERPLTAAARPTAPSAAARPTPPVAARPAPPITDPGTTLSSSAGQLAAVGVPVAQSTMRIGQRRQQVGAVVLAGLAAAAGLAFFMTDRVRRRPASSAVPAPVAAPSPSENTPGVAPSPERMPAVAPSAARTPEPASPAPPASAEAPTAVQAPANPEAPADDATQLAQPEPKRSSPPPAAVLGRPARAPARAGKASRRGREASVQREVLSGSLPPPLPNALPPPAAPPPPRLDGPTPAVSPPPVSPSPPLTPAAVRGDAGVAPRPKLNTEKW